MTNTGRSGYRIRNWALFQHYKFRDPPWIKLHRKILDDLEWHELDPLSAKTLLSFWLIASEYEGVLPNSKVLAHRLRSTEKAINSAISKLSHWLEHDDSIPIAEGLPDAIPEKEKKKTVEKKVQTIFVVPDNIRPETWAAFEDHRKKLRKPMTDHARGLILKELEKLDQDPNALLDQSIRKGWQDVFPLKDPVPLPASVTELIGANEKKPPQKNKCRCGKYATSYLGGEWECDDCILEMSTNL